MQMNKFLSNKFGNNFLLLLFALLTETAYIIYSIFENSKETILLYMIIYAAAFLLLIAANYFIKEKQCGENNGCFNPLNKNGWNKTLVIIFIAGLIFRITVMPAKYSTSDDVERYIWEGKILVNGFNPFEHSPDSDELKHLHSERLPEKVTFKNMTTIYPAVAQIIFAAGYLMSGENETGLKIIYLFFETLTFVFIIKLLRLKKLNDNLLIYYAWLPLPVMEYFINSHIDVAGLPFLLMFLYYAEKNNFLKSLITFTAAVLVKLFPFILAPLLIKKFGLRKSLLFAVLFGVIFLIISYPFIPFNKSVDSSLFIYLKNWSFNGSVYKLFETIFSSGEIARIITLILFVISAFLISFFYKNFLEAAYGILILFIAFAATLYPWYLGWIAAVNPLFNFSSVFYFFFSINITNVTPMWEVWKEYLWIYLIQYIPFYILLFLNLKTLIKNSENHEKKT